MDSGTSIVAALVEKGSDSGVLVKATEKVTMTGSVYLTWLGVFVFMGGCKGDNANFTVIPVLEKLLDNSELENGTISGEDSSFTMIPANIEEANGTTEFSGKYETTRKPSIVTSQTVNFTEITSSVPVLVKESISGSVSRNVSIPVPLSGNDSIPVSVSRNDSIPVSVSKNYSIPVSVSRNDTIPASVSKNESIPVSSSIQEFTVTSQPIVLKSSDVDPPNEKESDLIDNQTAEDSYKTKTPPVYHTYLDEIREANESEDVTGEPIRIRVQSVDNVNTIPQPYGPIAKFAEKELNKIRLNHWRVRQLLKGQYGPYSDPNLGELGTRKRSSPLAVFPTVSSLSQDEFHTSVAAADDDAILETSSALAQSPSKVRTFFDWISNPLGRQPSHEEIHQKQAKAQQTILPFALAYRGDFLFW